MLALGEERYLGIISPGHDRLVWGVYRLGLVAGLCPADESEGWRDGGEEGRALVDGIVKRYGGFEFLQVVGVGVGVVADRGMTSFFI